MSTASAALSPPAAAQPAEPAHAAPSAAKRKRPASQADAPAGAQPLQAVLVAVLEILRDFDTAPSVLDEPVRRADSGEPVSKRSKLVQPPPAAADALSVAAKVQSDAYRSLHELAADVDSVCDQLHAAAADTSTAIRLLALKTALGDIVHRETQRTRVDVADDAAETNGGAVKEAAPDADADSGRGSRAALTLFASAQGNKHLFSSLQRPVTVASASYPGTTIEVTPELDESSLPTNISATQIIPLSSADAVAAKAKVRTYGEVFAPPPTLGVLKPPTLTRQTAAKGNVIVWGQQDPINQHSRDSSYANQWLSTGHWLDYSGLNYHETVTFPAGNKKPRDLPLTTTSKSQSHHLSGPKPATHAEMARTDALFRSVYSTFAPAYDNGDAIIPEETKSQVWWQRVGQQTFKQLFALDPALANTPPRDAADEPSAVGDSKDAVEEAGPTPEPPLPEELNITDKSTNGDTNHKDADELLQETSDLLDTLHSYRCIRLNTLALEPTASDHQSSALQQVAPSSDEMAVYTLLNTKLINMISMLPPYAVAKLNGDQLEDLNVSRKLVIRTRDYQGVLEEDPVFKLANTAVIGTNAAAAAARPPGYPTPGQYARAPSGAQYATRAVGGPASHYSQQQQQPQAPGRTPSVARYPSQSYQTSSTYASPAQRPSYGGGPGLGQPPRQASHGTVAPAYTQATYGKATPAGHTAQSYYPTTSQTAVQNRYMQPAPGHPPRTQASAPMYNYTSTGSPHVRTASPQKQAPSGTTQTPYASGPPGKQPQSASPHSQTPQPLASLGNANYHTNTQAHAAPALSKSAPQANMSRTSSGTPQPPGSANQSRLNGQSQVQGNATTVVS